MKGWASIPESYVTQVPIITLDRLLGNALENRRSLILVDIEGAEYMLLKGALATLKHHPRPVWMVEISTTEHQPFGTTINPNFSNTFDMFLRHGYKAFTAEDSSQPVSEDLIKRVQVGEAKLKTHNFIFR
ncbi:FkbM family methyltransferase [Cylindrospermopsis curvispora]|uniref:FkbM family methyltransferase n=1 Tax=Cylindrospermopsis curvispora GIHE-G1 TaxID=2666332 RepID=A0A7H0F4W6_9CYAN|nr:FkbM family methyltransferase [Cylindrospermopsis curvispora GIHE-G1]